MKPFGRAMLSEWMLDPNVVYLNHGTVGCTPRKVLAAQQAIRDEIEANPARFLIRELADLKQITLRRRPRLREAADVVGEFLGARGADLAFVDNATAGANSVLRSFDFRPGDEILVTDHNYGAVTNAAIYAASRTGAHVRTVTMPYPHLTAEGVVAAIEAALTDRTVMVIVDHVTSWSALVFPIATIAAICRARGVTVLVDGAHAPGAIDLDIASLGVDWYTGNLHKWALTPRSSAILWVARARQATTHPVTISWGHEKGFDAEFDWLGTSDPSRWLSAPAAIAFMQELGVEAMRKYNHDFAWNAARSLTARWGTELLSAESMVGTMATLPLPERFGTTPEDAARLKDTLLYDDGIEAYLYPFRDRVWLRISGQVYNDASDLERLVQAIEARAGR